MKRIVFTVASGGAKFAKCALGLGRSLKLIGDETERVVVTDQIDHPWRKSFAEILPPQKAQKLVFFSKLSGLDLTDADQVLAIDSDSLAFKRLPEIFDYCEGRGLCVQGFPVTEGQWYGSVDEQLKRHQVKSLPRFNGGMIYYERTHECQQLLDHVKELSLRAESLGFDLDHERIPEEPILSLAMAMSGKGHLIPEEMDFTNSATGLIGKLTLDVKNNDCHFVCRRNDVRFIRPYLFHASRYVNFLGYWRQLEYLERLEVYEEVHEFGHMPYLHRLRRSAERRILKLTGRI